MEFRCKKKIEKQLQDKFEKKELQIREQGYIETIKLLKEELAYCQKMLSGAGSVISKQSDALTYANIHYKSAPPLKALDNYAAICEPDNDQKLVEKLVHQKRHKLLEKYVVDSLLKAYKKDNPADQSVWSSDNSRLTYINKRYISKNESDWMRDKKGNKTIECIIDPFLNFLKDVLQKYNADQDILKGCSLAELKKISLIKQDSCEIIQMIDDKVLANGVLKYLAPHLSFQKKQKDTDKQNDKEDDKQDLEENSDEDILSELSDE